MNSQRTFKAPEKYMRLLSSNEKKLLPILIEAAKKADKIFLLQEDNKSNGANLYPRDATKSEIESAGASNPKIFSPYTVIERNDKGKLTAIDYHVKYAKEITQISSLLKSASSICQNKSFKKYLDILSQSLIGGNYEEIDKAWLSVKGSNLDIVIGPYERYIDKLFFIKKAYQGSVGIIDAEKTKKARLIRDILYTTIGDKPHRIVPPSVVDMQVQYALIFAGLLGRMFFSQQHLPSDSATVEKYGSRIIGYISSIDNKFEKLIYPVFNAIFEKTFKASYPKELLRTGNYYYVLLHGVAQNLHRYKNSRDRLKELFPIYDEANSVVSGVQHAKHLVLKGAIDQKELEAIMITHLCWIFSEWVISRKSNIREDYLKGDAITLNFLRREGAIQEKEGISWPNFAKMFFEMENLSTIFTGFLENGSYLEAQEFISKYLSLEPFKAFEKRLSGIKPL